MSEADTIVEKLLPIVNFSMVIDEYTKEELADIIFVNSEERLKILKQLMSQFSEDYKYDLESSPDVELELISQIYALQFSDDSNKIRFVKADCPVKEQVMIYERIITALGFLKLAEYKHDKEENKSNNSVTLPHLDLISNEDQREKKGFNLYEAKKKLDRATQLIEKYKHYLEEPTGMQGQCHQICESLLNDADLANMCENITLVSSIINNQQFDSIPEHQLEPSQDITKLHDILVANEEAFSNSEKDDLEVELFNPRTFFEDMNKFRNDSVLLNLIN